MDKKNDEAEQNRFEFPVEQVEGACDRVFAALDTEVVSAFSATDRNAWPYALVILRSITAKVLADSEEIDNAVVYAEQLVENTKFILRAKKERTRKLQ